MNKGFEINGTMDLGHMSPLEQQENVMEKKINEQTLRQIVRESLKELSNQTIGSYMRATKNQRRDRQYDAGKWHAIKTVNDKYSFCVTLDLGEEVLFTLGMENEEFFILVDVDEHIENKEPYTLKLMANNPRRMLDGTPITETTVGYVIDNLRAGERMKLKGLCQSAMELNQALRGKQAQVAEGKNELRNLIRETVQMHLVNVLGKYTQGKTSSKEANKAIMDLANSSNKKKVNEDVDARTAAYFDKIRNGECETLEFEGKIYSVPPQLKQIAQKTSNEFGVKVSTYVGEDERKLYYGLLVDVPEDCVFPTLSNNIRLFLLDYDIHYIGWYKRGIFFYQQIMKKPY